MSVINFKKANCKNCYRCIRVCPVKAIRVENEQAEIIESECILCGSCLKVCPQNAKKVRNDISRVKDMFRAGRRVVVSIAPSFVGVFEYLRPGQVVAAFKKLGFAAVHETAAGAAVVSREYRRLIEEGKMTNIITSACPVVNGLIEKYYPDLIPYLAPVASPMVVHGKMLKKHYGRDTGVVFAGPCICKKDEADDIRNEGAVDAVLTFEEIVEWLEDEGINVSAQPDECFGGLNPGRARYYPISTGIIKSFIKNPEDEYYCVMSVDGIDRCIETLDALRDGQLFGYFIEMNACAGGCLNGPAMPEIEGRYFRIRQRLLKYAGSDQTAKQGSMQCMDGIDLSVCFIDRSAHEPVPGEKTIREILEKIGKFTREQELNCGACGYPTCRDKAIAVYQGKAELYMCLPYMRERAESLANVIIASTPNAIIAVDRDMIIQEFNDAAVDMFNIPREKALGMGLYEFIDTGDFEYVASTGQNIFNKKVEYPEYGVITEQTIVFVQNQGVVIGILRDVTREEKQMKKIYDMRMETINMAQKVIDKQMVVAQQIASLLGETTAETKVTLTRLKNLILYDGEDRG